MKRREQVRNRKRKQREKENNQIHSKKTDECFFNYATEEEFIQTTKEFDILNEQLTYKRCTCCRKVRLAMKVEQQTIGY